MKPLDYDSRKAWALGSLFDALVSTINSRVSLEDPLDLSHDEVANICCSVAALKESMRHLEALIDSEILTPWLEIYKEIMIGDIKIYLGKDKTEKIDQVSGMRLALDTLGLESALTLLSSSAIKPGEWKKKNLPSDMIKTEYGELSVRKTTVKPDGK